MAGIHLVVSCAKRKTQYPNPSLRLGGINRKFPIERRAIEWIGRLRKCSPGNRPAGELYSGDHWHTVRSILDFSEKAMVPVRIWVCSAGYGLLPIETPLKPYSATFSPGDEDSVCNRSDLRTSLPKWWASIATYRGVHDGPRTIAELARKFSNDFLLVALPQSYLFAVADDLRATVKTVRIAERLAVLSVGGSVPAEVEPNFLVTGAKLQSVAGGSLGSLNARLARILITKLASKPMTLERCKRVLGELSKLAPETVPLARLKMTDDEVVDAIRHYLKANPMSSATGLLRRFRESGRACKHSRFVSLYRQINGAENGRL